MTRRTLWRITDETGVICQLEKKRDCLRWWAGKYGEGKVKHELIEPGHYLLYAKEGNRRTYSVVARLDNVM